MANETEPAKLLLPYLQRADELQKHEPLVAYYCRLYAMERGLKIPQSGRTKTTNALLVSLMKQLEKDKKSLNLGPDDSLHVEGFALNIFTRADKQDRAGRADLNTAKTFYAASIFFEILNQFGELPPDLEQKQKYAAWKAADIRKAMKEGRKPVPGPPGGDDDLSLPTSSTSGEYDFEPNGVDPALKPASQPDPPPQFYNHPNPQSPPAVPPSPPSHMTSPPPPPPPPPAYPTDEYPSHNFHQTPSNNRPENPTYPEPYHQPYHPPDHPQQHLPQNYPSHDISPYSYPNFKSYPSFTESSLPTAPTHHPSYYQGADAPSYSSPPSAANMTNYPPTIQHDSSIKRGGAVSEAAAVSPQAYQVDSNYQPPPEKIAEAHKAARFAVGALAFDDVFVAVDFLKKSLELLTNPSAGQ